MKDQISADDFKRILKGEFYNTGHDYSKFYSEVQGYGLHVAIKNVLVNEDVSLLDEFEYPMGIRISNSVFNGNFSIKNASIKIFGIDHTIFNQSLFFDDSRIDEISIIEISIERQFSFRNVISKETLFLVGIKKGFILFENNELNRVTISVHNTKIIRILGDKTLINWLHLDERNTCNIEISNVVINHLQFSGNYKESNLIKIINAKLHWLNFYDFQNSGKMIWQNIKVLRFSKIKSNITLSEFFNKKDVTEKDKLELLQVNKHIIDFKNVLLNDIFIDRNCNYSKLFFKYNFEDTNEEKTKSELKFNNIILGNTELKNVDMQKFELITINDTELTSVKLFNSSLPTQKIKGNPNSLYETFNDLFSVAKKQNNKRDEIEYYKASQTALLSSLLNKSWYKNVPSIISLFISKWYSDFGTRWTQALFWALFFGGFFFILMNCLTKYDLDFSFQDNSWDNFKDLTAYYIQYLNPTHKITFMDSIIKNASKSTWFVLFDFIGRIFVSIGIFELIRSFRKYVRK